MGHLRLTAGASAHNSAKQRMLRRCAQRLSRPLAS